MILKSSRKTAFEYAVPVVRCKDCVRRGTPECGMYYECECGQQHTWETDNDFCSFGKRKEKNKWVK